MTWKQFSYLPRSLASTAASENGARQCARDYWECTHLLATQSQIPIEEESCPPCKYSIRQTSTNLIRFCGRTVLLRETCSRRALPREPAAPSKLMDVVRCSCKADGKVCSGRSRYGSNGMSCTSYCVCEGGMLAGCAVTHLLNRRRTKATHNRVKWILMNLRRRE